MLGVVGAVLLAVVAFGVMAIFVLKFDSARKAIPNMQVIYLDTVDVNEIQGESYSLDDQKGRIEYIIDEDVFFDRNRGILYIHFGLTEYEEQVYLRGDYEWRTQAIAPGTGITEVSCPSGNAPSYIEICSKYDETDGHFIVTHHLNVAEGTTAEAEEWLEEKYGPDDQTEEFTTDNTVPPAVENTETPSASTVPATSTTTDDRLIDDIVGKWEAYDIATSIETGEDTLYLWRWTFNADGTVYKVTYRCKADTNGSEYYLGQSWTRYDGEAGAGTYTFDGNVLSITAHEINGDIYNTTTYQVEIENDVLRLTNSAMPSVLSRIG